MEYIEETDTLYTETYLYGTFFYVKLNKFVILSDVKLIFFTIKRFFFCKVDKYNNSILF